MEDRVCTSCGEEFQPTVEICLDCGGPTVPVGQAAALPPAPEAPVHLEPGQEAMVVRTADYDWATHLAEKIEAAGVRYALLGDTACCPPKYTVLVAGADLERAVEIDREVYRERVPDAAGGLPGEAGENCCPACGTPVEPTAEECGECGLGLAPPEAAID